MRWASRPRRASCRWPKPMNDHRIFLGFIGLVPAAVWAIRLVAGSRPEWDSPGARRIVVAGCAILLAAHVAGTAVRNRVWRTGSLWRDVTLKSPGNGRGHMNYGLALMERGDYAGARKAFDEARKTLPNYAYLEVNFGVLEGATGHPEEAEANFRRAIVLDPVAPMTRSFFAQWLTTQRRSPEAIPLLEQALRRSPADGTSRNLLTNLLAAHGDVEAATAVAREALRINPGDESARAYASGGFPDAGYGRAEALRKGGGAGQPAPSRGCGSRLSGRPEVEPEVGGCPQQPWLDPRRAGVSGRRPAVLEARPRVPPELGARARQSCFPRPAALNRKPAGRGPFVRRGSWG